jgi:hypothetical protein
VKNRFQNLPFKFNLQRYTAVRPGTRGGAGTGNITVPDEDSRLVEKSSNQAAGREMARRSFNAARGKGDGSTTPRGSSTGGGAPNNGGALHVEAS